jgi:DNA-directed RNA polymerase specialized sigma24 family protein
VQSALVKVAALVGAVRRAPEAYLRTVLSRDAVSCWRRQRREITVALPPEPRSGPDAAEVPLRMVFAAALRRLTPRQRAVLVLRFFGDHTEARTRRCSA